MTFAVPALTYTESDFSVEGFFAQIHSFAGNNYALILSCVLSLTMSTLVLCFPYSTRLQQHRLSPCV